MTIEAFSCSLFPFAKHVILLRSNFIHMMRSVCIVDLAYKNKLRMNPTTRVLTFSFTHSLHTYRVALALFMHIHPLSAT